MNRLPLIGWVLLATLLPLLYGCASTGVYLMPTPVAIQPDSDLFVQTEGSRSGNYLLTLYATNRPPFNITESSRSYSIFPSDDLRLGYSIHSIGAAGMSWEELYATSLRRDRREDLLITLEFNQEEAVFDKARQVTELTLEQQEFFAKINATLQRTADKDITVYVHGANSSFYRATAQGAQYFHYTGHNSLVLNFSWPSAENIFKYKVDVLHARKTVPAFARLLEILARHTRARNINILAYSAGAQVVAPALVLLRDEHLEEDPGEIRSRLRLGEVYFAAPDIELESFAFRYHRFKDIVLRTTISSNADDSVLRYSSMHSGRTRLGRPRQGELSIAEETIFISQSSTGTLDLIDIQGSTALAAGSSHDFWYSHPWVSTDLLLLMLFNLPPDQRGLARHTGENGLVFYRFPDDYRERVEERIKDLRSSSLKHKSLTAAGFPEIAVEQAAGARCDHGEETGSPGRSPPPAPAFP